MLLSKIGTEWYFTRHYYNPEVGGWNYDTIGFNEEGVATADLATSWQALNIDGLPVEPNPVVIRDHLFWVVVDGARTTNFTLSGGLLTLPGVATGAVTVGYPSDFEIIPNPPIEFGDFGSIKRCSKIGLYLLESGGCTIEINDRESPFKDSILLAAGERLTGPYEITVGGGYNGEIRVKLSGNHHKPFNLAGLAFHASTR